MSETDVLKKKEEEKINDLLFDLVKGKYGRELERANKLDDEARQLIGSVLIVVGFLLGAGAINLLSIHSWSSSLYFTGIAVLLVSIVMDYKAISKPKENYDPFQVQDILYEKVAPIVDADQYLETVRKHIRSMTNTITINESSNRRKAVLITYAWFLLIPGLAMVVLFIIFSSVNIITPHCPAGNSVEYCKGYEAGYNFNSGGPSVSK